MTEAEKRTFLMEATARRMFVEEKKGFADIMDHLRIHFKATREERSKAVAEMLRKG